MEPEQVEGPGDHLRESAGRAAAAGGRDGPPARAGQLALPHREPRVGRRVRRLRLEGRGQDLLVQHHPRTGRAARPLRRRLRLPLRRRLVPGAIRGSGGRRRRRVGVPLVRHGHTGAADGVAGRETARRAPDAGAGQVDGAEGHLVRHGHLPRAVRERTARPLRPRTPDAARHGRRGEGHAQGRTGPHGGDVRGGEPGRHLADPGRGGARPGAGTAQPRRAVRGTAGLASAGVRRRRLEGRGLPAGGAWAGSRLVPHRVPARDRPGRGRLDRAHPHRRPGPRLPRPDLPERLEHGPVHQRRRPPAHLRPARRRPAHPGRQHPGPRRTVRRHHPGRSRRGEADADGQRGRRGTGDTGGLPGRAHARAS